MPKYLASLLGSSMFLNIQENALKGQIQSYMSNPESMLKLPSLDKIPLSSFKKEAKNGEKQDLINKYVNTDENRIDEHSNDYDLESGKKVKIERETGSSERIPNESPKVSIRKNDSDEIRKKAIFNQMMKKPIDLNEEEKKEEDMNFSLKISKE